MIIACDLDGTLCVEVEKWWEDEDPTPIQMNVNKLMDLYRQGNTIIINTARPWGDYEKTKAWLERHGVSFDILAMGKVRADLYIDNDSKRMEELL